MQKIGIRFRAHGATGSLAVFLMIALFACMVFVLTILGAKGYRAVVNGAAENANDRILQFYLVNKLRAAQDLKSVSVEQGDGTDVLLIRDEADASVYLTRIYCYGGSLMESYDAADAAFDPELGQRLCPARALSVRIEDGLCEISITAEDGGIHDSCVYLAYDRG